MPDRRISDLPISTNPGPDTATVPLIESAVVGGITINTNYRTTVRNIVAAGINAGVASLDSLSDVAVASPTANNVLSFISGEWRARDENSLTDGGNF